MTTEQLLELYDSLHQRQLRDAASEIAAAIAHAMGTPLNVISGRAELIRQDPTRAALQAGKIEEQVRNMASGLRQLVDYLAPLESTTAGVPVRNIVSEALGMARPIAQRQGVELIVDEEIRSCDAPLPRWQVLTNVTTLISLAVRCTARSMTDARERRVLLGCSADAGGVTFDLDTPGLEIVEGWQLDKFQARPLPASVSEHYRVLSVCATIARGNGGRLSIEPIDGGGRIRLLCRSAV